ncbi:oxygen-dependent tRNA uridine(34) hydroxylase TrhO [Sphingomicrobium lutaoense]|uniref:tRNA uridine(34) hydroxylase n=1 Tax=Sphingomicrobium lutaoense TaxID=515949 RepID=A0A839Z5I8_9SPHN|nr:rhodanese-related sulfurtransferase [Sphingomicrobium lutaoense]MBB3764935.1 UPF0176 protein [Sphingomicrobium lutaoense]
MRPETPPSSVMAFYCFSRFDAPAALRAPLIERCEGLGIKGTILLAPEGLNGTVAGTRPALEELLAHLRALPGCAAMPVKWSTASTPPFHRMKVRLKREIVTMGVEGIDPGQIVGTYVPPAEWNELIADPDTILIDTRNDYEVAIGTFKGAIDPQTRSFGDLPGWLREQRPRWEAEGRTPRVAMFCTGGIRCEKSTAFLKAEGVDEVYHLEGGILAYLEQVAPAESVWEGDCFVFDERVSVGHGLKVGDYRLCRACRMPVSAADRASPLYEEGASCPACHDIRSEEQRRRYRERHRQTQLAARRGKTHVGARPPESE